MSGYYQIFRWRLKKNKKRKFFKKQTPKNYMWDLKEIIPYLVILEEFDGSFDIKLSCPKKFHSCWLGHQPCTVWLLPAAHLTQELLHCLDKQTMRWCCQKGEDDNGANNQNQTATEINQTSRCETREGSGSSHLTDSRKLTAKSKIGARIGVFTSVHVPVLKLNLYKWQKQARALEHAIDNSWRNGTVCLKHTGSFVCTPSA